MRQLFLVLICLVFIQNFSQAQVYNHVFAAGFNTIGYELAPLGDGRWLAVGVGNELPGKWYTDSIVAVVFNDKGVVIRRHILQLPESPKHYIQAATGTSDGGYAITIEHFSTDVATGRGSLLVFDRDGQLRWSRESSWGEWTMPYPLISTPDGHLLGVQDQNEKFVKYDLQTGEVLFEAAMQTSAWIKDFAYVPGTENLVGVGFPNFQFWEKTGPPGAPVYQLSEASIQPFASVSFLAEGPAGQYFTLDGHNGRVFEFTVPDLTFTEILDLPFKIYGLTATAQGLILCSQPDSMPHLLAADFSGQITDTIRIADKWQFAYRIAVQDSTLALLGYGGSGPPVSGQPWYPYNSMQLWVQTRPLPPFDQVETLPNAALAGMSQASGLQVKTSNGWYSFNGGQFSAQVQNTGSQTLHSVDIMIGFDWIKDYYRPVERRHFSGFSLAPGESIWLNFGDVNAIGQTKAPTQLCFWTARPNEKPDANRDDDIFCHTVLVNADEPKPASLAVSPNPVSDGFWVRAPENIPSCNLFDYTGRLIQTTRIPAGETRFFIPTADFPNGVYFLQLGAFVEKIMVRHDR